MQRPPDGGRYRLAGGAGQGWLDIEIVSAELTLARQTSTGECMRLALCLAVALSAILGGCSLPPVVTSADYSTRCEIEGVPPPGSLLFATARMPNCEGPTQRITDLRGTRLMYGALERNGAVRFYHPKTWWDALAERLSHAHPPLLFIHGYNNSNGSALGAALAIEHATRGTHEVIALTWPSYDRIPKYFWDETNAAWAQGMSGELVRQLATMPGKLTVVGHSMGNHLALDGVTGLEPTFRSQHIAALIMASPDIDRANMHRALDQGLGIPVTIYGSTRDQALSASWRAHGMPRAGDLAAWVTGHTPDYSLEDIPGANIVDTSLVTTGVVHHSDFISTPEGAADLCRVVSDPANLKNGRESVPGHTGRWVLKKGNLGDLCATSGAEAYQWLVQKAPKPRK
jgi:pimeloyl-ACP methyl ester carboxylesterase